MIAFDEACPKHFFSPGASESCWAVTVAEQMIQMLCARLFQAKSMLEYLLKGVWTVTADDPETVPGVCRSKTRELIGLPVSSSLIIEIPPNVPGTGALGKTGLGTLNR